MLCLVGGMENNEEGIVKYLGEENKKERSWFSFILFGRKKKSNLICFIIMISKLEDNERVRLK